VNDMFKRLALLQQLWPSLIVCSVRCYMWLLFLGMDVLV